MKKEIKNKVRKQNVEKAIAKLIWYSTMMITFLAVIVIFAVMGAMVEEMMFTFPRILTVAICSGWIALYALFIVWVESKD